MRKIAIIPARSGSKGLVNKNILNLCGKPLIAWSIEAAIKSKEFDRVILSTDSKQYGEIGMKYGAEIIYRGEGLSNDKATTFDVLKDIFNRINTEGIEYFVLLQPTSPLRNESHIIESIKLYESNIKKIDTLVSVCEAHKSSDLVKQIDDNMSLKYFDKDFSNYRRQRYKEYEPNGAIFISKIDTYLKVKHFFGEQGIAYVMDSTSSIDIDGKNDFLLAIDIINQKKAYLNTREQVINRIKDKLDYLTSDCNYDIALIGHSIIDQWNVKEIKGKKVHNYGINGITTDLYIDFLNREKIKIKEKTVVIMIGLNDTKFVSCDEILKDLEILLKQINLYNDKRILITTPTNVNGRIDFDNIKIDELNSLIVNVYSDRYRIIDTSRLNDKFGWLDTKLSNDGLHLNEEGYSILQKLIEEVL